MAKHFRKVTAGMQRRKNGFVPNMPNGQQCHEPGSQNRKKSGTGYKGNR